MSEALRIGLFVYEFPALSETFVLGQMTGLIDNGCDVRIFAHARRAGEFPHGDVARYNLLDRTSYLDMPRSKLARLCAAISLIGRHRRRCARALCRSLNVFRYGREALSLKLLFWTARLAEAGDRFDVIYCHFGPVGRTAAFLRDIGAVKGKLVTAFHGVDVSASLRQNPGLYRHLFAQGDAFLPISRHWSKRLQAHGCDPNRLIIHHMGVDISRFRCRPREPDASGATRLLTVGRLVEKKGIIYALQAARLAHERGLRLRYTIIGNGPLRQSLEAMTDELRIRDIVAFVGWCDQKGVLQKMYANDILIAPSITDRTGDQEGIPVTLMEAMATGMPVISTQHSAIPELVADGVSGILVAEADVESLAAAIEKLTRDPVRRAIMGRQGQAAVATDFDAAVLNQRLVHLFQAISRTPVVPHHADISPPPPGDDVRVPRSDYASPRPRVTHSVPDRRARMSTAISTGRRPHGETIGLSWE